MDGSWLANLLYASHTGGCCFLFLDDFFDVRIPFATGRAFTQPFGRLVAAVLTEEGCFYFAHAVAKVEKEKATTERGLLYMQLESVISIIGVFL